LLIPSPRPVCALDINQILRPQIVAGFRPRAGRFPLRNRIKPRRNFTIDANGRATGISKFETRPAAEGNALSSAGDFLNHDERADTLCG
jgi:hypothetical protein